MADFKTLYYNSRLKSGQGGAVSMTFTLVSSLNAPVLLYRDEKIKQNLEVSLDASGKNLIQQYNDWGGGKQEAPRVCNPQ